MGQVPGGAGLKLEGASRASFREGGAEDVKLGHGRWEIGVRRGEVAGCQMGFGISKMRGASLEAEQWDVRAQVSATYWAAAAVY